MSILKKAKEKAVNLYQKTAEKIARAKEKVLLATVVIAVPMSANASTLDEIGEKIAGAINAFIGVISAIGMAAITVVVLIQGFKLAFSMIKTVK